MKGYFRHPTVYRDQVVFVSEDDLWSVFLKGGIPRRLTSGVGTISAPVLSRDGRFLAFCGSEEGHREVYWMEAQGGPINRLTYLGADSTPVGWDFNGKVIFGSNADHPHWQSELFSVGLEGGTPEALKLGPAVFFNLAEDGWILLERNSHRPDPAHWKRYRGGTAGVLWISPGIDRPFKQLLQIESNLARPMWVGDRVYFLSDHEGIANVYSCNRTGLDLKQHTREQRYYCRNPHTDGQTIVYHAGGDLYALDITTNQTHKIEIDYRSQQTQRQRKFVTAKNYLEHYRLNPNGEQTLITSRGQIFSLKNWDGPVSRIGNQPSVRYRQGDWLFDEKRVIVVSDDGGEERLEIYTPGKESPEQILHDLDIGRVTYLRASPNQAKVALTNHRNELVLIDLETKNLTVVDRDQFMHLEYFEWSPDGAMIAYARANDLARTSSIKVYLINEERSLDVTPTGCWDFGPSWDPEGRFLYFLSRRILDPVYDNVQFDLSFPRGVIPCLVSLRRNISSPFLVPLKPEGKSEAKVDGQNEGKTETSGNEKSENPSETKSKNVVPIVVPIKVDWDGIKERILTFPVSDGRYLCIKGLSGKVLWEIAPIKGALKTRWLQGDPPNENRLEVFDFETRKSETLASDISRFDVSRDRKQMILQVRRDLRVLKAGEKIDDKEQKSSFSKKSGWLDLSRLRVLIEPGQEWQQMLKEVWRLQRDHFWHSGMAKIDWPAALSRYLPLVDRVQCRSEFSDLVWELQGELGTSHAYDIGGDYRRAPHYGIGFLGARFKFDPTHSGYRIEKIYRGDTWSFSELSPLAQLGVQVECGDILLAINGESLSSDLSPEQLLVHRAYSEIELTVLPKNAKEPVNYIVKTLGDESPARYRDWVEQNRRAVSQMSNGRVGYLHIPDMGPRGFSEFYRAFLAEFNRDALIVDVRYNGGGHVSQLLLEKLARKPLGISYSRWFGLQTELAGPVGPLVAITNEYAGSDGDIFSHTFKMRNLGPLIGKRTWGGVVGIWPKHALVDGSITTQPEYATWFSDVGWNVENYGTDPTIEVEFAPHDYRQGKDPQLARAVTEALHLLEKNPPFRPPINLDAVDLRGPSES